MRGVTIGGEGCPARARIRLIDGEQAVAAHVRIQVPGLPLGWPVVAVRHKGASGDDRAVARVLIGMNRVNEAWVCGAIRR